MSPFIVPVSLFVMIALIVIVPRYFRSLERQKLQETLRAAIERGQPIPPEVIESITSDARDFDREARSPHRAPSPHRDLRRGLVWLGVAMGFVGLGAALSFEEPDAFYPLLGVAAFPGFVGLAFIIIFFASRQK
jgi:hypothetical protein